MYVIVYALHRIVLQRVVIVVLQYGYCNVIVVDALRRVGLPDHFRSMIRAMYVERLFEVWGCGEGSASAGVRSLPGWPSIATFILIVMERLMQDAHTMLSEASINAIRRGDLFDLLYADNTLVCGTSITTVQEFAITLECAGAMYGMSLNWQKT